MRVGSAGAETRGAVSQCAVDMHSRDAGRRSGAEVRCSSAERTVQIRGGMGLRCGGASRSWGAAEVCGRAVGQRCVADARGSIEVWRVRTEVRAGVVTAVYDYRSAENISPS